MKSKIYKKSKILIIAVLIVLLITPCVANAAFSFKDSSNNSFVSIMEFVRKRYADANQYKNFLNELKAFIESIEPSISVDDAKIEVIDKVSELQKKYSETAAVSSAANQILNVTITSNNANTSGLLDNLIGSVTSLLGKTNAITQSLTPDVVVENMSATTAGKLAGDDYKVNLSGKIYYAGVNQNGQPTSDKWVILVHGFLMNGQAMADAFGQMYLDQGYNVLAPDLRGFGDSDGSVAMGYLESLDVWDWITYLNDKYPNNCNGIIVHGVSLGGATTVFLSGLEVDGVKLKDKNVIGLVEDCGYRSMTGIITDMLGGGSDDSLIIKVLGLLNVDSLAEGLIETAIMDLVGVGLTDENFDEKQNALNSLSKSELPLLIIHGTADTTVPVSNSTEIYNVAVQNQNIPYVQKFIAEGESHAFITMGTQYNVYEGHVENFIKQAESIANGSTVNKISDYQQEEPEETSLITTLVRALKLIGNILNIG